MSKTNTKVASVAAITIPQLPENTWANFGDQYRIREVSNNSKTLAPAVYNVEADQQGMYLRMMSADFRLPKKIYNNEVNFINKVCKTWDNTIGNMGIILCGEKGSGKTVTSKQICQRLGLPVILVEKDFEEGFPEFASKIDQDVVFLFDEFEKTHGETHHLLSFLDGAATSPRNRRMFIMTTNTLYVHDAMLNRPSRIRYKKEFGNLKKDVIDELIDDALVDKKLRKQTFEYISKLKLITIDIVLSVVQEINIHGEMPTDFNVDVNSLKKLIEIKPGKSKFDVVEVPVASTRISIDEDDLTVGDTFYFNNSDYGEIIDYNPVRNIITVEKNERIKDKYVKKKHVYRIDSGYFTNFHAMDAY